MGVYRFLFHSHIYSRRMNFSIFPDISVYICLFVRQKASSVHCAGKCQSHQCGRRQMAKIFLCCISVVKGRECSVLPYGKNSPHTTKGEPGCDLVIMNEPRDHVCILYRLHSPRMFLWSTRCVLKVVLLTIFSRDLVSHIFPPQHWVLDCWSTRDQLSKNHNFLPLTTSHSLC